MQRNIQLSKIIQALSVSWFWYGIFILYYLRFTNYAGIGVLEVIFTILAFTFEIPTGALADLIGKKVTIHIALLIAALGIGLMGFASNIIILALSAAVYSLGRSLLSGTSDALVYDSAKALHIEKQYKGISSTISTYRLIFLSIASIIGGFSYNLNFHLPFILTSFALLIAFICSLFLIEPEGEKVIYSFSNFIMQNSIGFKELFKQKEQLSWIIKLFLLSSLMYLITAGIDPTLAIKYGLSGTGLGILFAIVPITSAIGIYFYGKYHVILKDSFMWIVMMGLFLASLMLSPVFGMYLGITFILIRSIFYPITGVIASNEINSFVTSKNRATTLSTYNMIITIPYLLSAFFIGLLIDHINAANTAFIISIVYILISAVLLLFFSHKQTEDTNLAINHK